eukprot:2423737-Rhodomonas_salina.2
MLCQYQRGYAATRVCRRQFVSTSDTKLLPAQESMLPLVQKSMLILVQESPLLHNRLCCLVQGRVEPYHRSLASPGCPRHLSARAALVRRCGPAGRRGGEQERDTTTSSGVRFGAGHVSRWMCTEAVHASGEHAGV